MDKVDQCNLLSVIPFSSVISPNLGISVIQIRSMIPRHC